MKHCLQSLTRLVPTALPGLAVVVRGVKLDHPSPNACQRKRRNDQRRAFGRTLACRRAKTGSTS